MANEWVTTVVISGPSAQLARVLELYPFDPKAIVPVPADVEAATPAAEEHAARLNVRGALSAASENPHPWRIEQWGATALWEIDVFLEEPTRLGIYTWTPHPPTGVFRALSERFPALEFGIVSHDIHCPDALALRYIAGRAFDTETWDSSEAALDDQCRNWVDVRRAWFGIPIGRATGA